VDSQSIPFSSTPIQAEQTFEGKPFCGIRLCHAFFLTGLCQTDRNLIVFVDLFSFYVSQYAKTFSISAF